MEFLPALGKTPSGERLDRISRSPHYGENGFQNEVPTEVMRKGASFVKILWEFMNKPKNTVPPAAIPAVKVDLKDLPENAVVWFGHSSYFIKITGLAILVDPVFCGYASPFSFSTKAFPGTDVYGVDDLPVIDAVVITHDHYDHLDYKTVQGLAEKGRHFYKSLGVGSHLEYWGIGASKITELDWWEEAAIGNGASLTAVPARHFSGRSFLRGKTFWSSFLLRTGDHVLYLGGDSGYGPHFKTIGERFGAIDLAILECGQYGKDWPAIHMLPEECVVAARELRARVLLPVHWGKFSLSLHPWDEPIRRLLKAGGEEGLVIATPMIGEPMILGRPVPRKAWWEGVVK